MKKLNLLVLMVTASLLMSCSKKEEHNSSDAGAPVALPGAPASNPPLLTVPNGTLSGTAGTVPFVPVSKEMMENYVASHPLNNPTNYRVSISLKNVGDLRFGGEVRIMYEDNGQTYTGIFTAPEGKNESYPSYDYNRDVGAYKAEYNYWYSSGGQTVFSGFFQDTFGAIVLVIDNAINLGDGQGGGTVSGSIYFKNFAYSFAPQSTLRNCWFLYMGPFDCRASAIQTKSSLEPSDGYRKLGSFSGLVKSQILN